MSTRKKLLTTAAALSLTLTGGATAISAMVPDPVEAPTPPTAATADEYRQTLEAMRPPKRLRPVVAVLGDNRGTEAIDFLIPYGVLKRADVAEVFAVGMTAAPLKLRPALAINAQLTAAEFDRRFAGGADYVVVPAMYDHHSPEVLAWIRAQAAKGATIVAICAGAEIVANAGLLQNRAATTHWASVSKIMETEPTMRWVPHRRYVADRGVVSTTGVSAAVPVSIALVEAIAGADRARGLAAEMGVAEWSQSHDSGGYRFGGGVATLLANGAAKWKHEDVGVPLSDGVDDIALALTADSWSRTYRSRALTVAASPKIRSRYGLELLVDENSRAGIERMLAPVDNKNPAQALDRALAQISSSYGKPTARLVAVQLEYDKFAGR
jgi:putative intracellular protease/amidase